MIHDPSHEECHYAIQFKLESFQILLKLGEGDYSVVYLAREKQLGFLCALKAIDK
jgi:serine/threonine protein kinase